MFDKVLVGVDGQSGGRDAIALAGQLAAADALITLVHVTRTEPRSLAPELAVPTPNLIHAQDLLERERAHARGDVRLVTHVSRSVAEGLHQLARLSGADLVVVGASRRGLIGRTLLGDDAAGVITAAPSPVAVAPAGYATRTTRLSRIGVGDDDSPETSHARMLGRGLAEATGGSVQALSVVSERFLLGGPVPDQWNELAAERIAYERDRLAQTGIAGEAVLGEPRSELVNFSHELDLLIVGSRSLGPVSRLLNGSVSHHLARHSACPLLVVPRSPRPIDLEAAV